MNPSCRQFISTGIEKGSKEDDRGPKRWNQGGHLHRTPFMNPSPDFSPDTRALTLAAVLENGYNEIHIDESIRQRALIATQRMLDFAKTRGINRVGKGNA